MGVFFTILHMGLWALGCCVYDMIMALSGNSKMDKFKKAHGIE